jgi:hypothetical protein
MKAARIVFGLFIIALVTGITATTSFGDPGLVPDPDLPNVPAHRHWLGDPANGVQIGPRLCDNPNVQKAFNQFHFNVHHSFIPPAAGGEGQYDTNGPQDGAPGLHNFKGGELIFTPGCAMP